MQENNSGKIRKLLINTILFAIGQFGSAFVSILFVPIYTNYMTTAEYGTADLINSLVAMLFPVFTLSIMDGIMRFALDGQHSVKEVFSISGIVCVAGAVICGLFYPAIEAFGQIQGYVGFFYLIMITRVFQNLLLAYVRALQNLKLYSVAAITNTLVMSASNVFLIVVCEMGIQGYLVSIVLGNIVSGLVALVAGKVWCFIDLHGVTKETTKEMVTFSLPLIPNNLSNWAMSSMDKYMLTAMLDVSYNGMYAVAHKIPSVVSMFAAVFNQAWNYSALEEQKSADPQAYYQSVFSIYSSYLFIIASAVMCVVRPVMMVWLGQEFREAWIYTPYLFVSTIFSCLIGFYVPLFVIAKKTQLLFISTAAGALVNLVLNACLIPLWQINGASLATVATFVTVWLIRDYLAGKHSGIKIKTHQAYINAGILMAQGTALIFSGNHWWILQSVFFAAMIGANFRQIKDMFERLIGFAKKTIFKH